MALELLTKTLTRDAFRAVLSEHISPNGWQWKRNWGLLGTVGAVSDVSRNKERVLSKTGLVKQ